MEHENKGFEEDLIDLESYIEEFSLFLPLAVCILSPNSIITNINKAFSRLTNYNETEIVGKQAEVLFKYKEWWKDSEANLSKEKTLEKNETTMISKTGEEIPISIFLSRREDKEGNFIGYFLGIDDITERKNAEYEIKESEEKYRLLAENSYDGILTTDRKGIINYASPALERMFDIPSSVSVGMHFSKYVTKKSALKGAKLFMDLILGKTGFYENIEFEAVHKDGHTFPIEVSASSLIRDGKSIGMVGIIRDITERKKIISELESTKEFSENILNSIIDSVVVVDLNGKIKRVNNAAIKQTGYTEEELIGMDGTIFLSEEAIPRVAFLLKDVLKKGVVSDIESVGLTKDRRRVPISINLTLLKDERGKAIGVIAASRDISQTKKLIKELQDAKNFSEGILNSMSDGLIIMNPQAEVVRINKAEEELMGYKQEELAGEVAFNIGKPDEIEKSMTLLKEAVEKGKAGPTELVSVTKDGREILLSTSMSTIKDAQGKVQVIFTVSRDISERKMFEDTLRESEETLSAIFEAAIDGVLYVDASGNFIQINKKLSEILGYKKEELIGKNFAEVGILDPKDIPRFLEMQAHGETVKNFELEVIRKNGNRIPTEINAAPIKKDNKIIGFSAIVRDITERKKAEEAIIESEEKLRSIFESVSDGFVYIDIDGNVLDVNKIIEKMLGYSKKEVVGKNFAELGVVESKDLPNILKIMADTTTGGKLIKNFELTLISKDGKKIPTEITTDVIKKEGKIIGLTTIIRDITERKKAQEALIESEEKLRSIFESTNDVVLYVDISGKILAVNKKVEEITGYKLDEIIEKNFTELRAIDPNDIPKFLSLTADALNFGKTIKNFEVEVRRKDGVKLPAEISTGLVKKEGKVVGIIVSVRDITERKILEEKISKRTSELEYANEFSETIFNSMIDGVVIVDLEGQIKKVNKNATENTGYTKEELIGMMGTKIISEDDTQKVTSLLKDVVEKGFIRDIEITQVAKDKRRIPVSVNLTLLKDADGKPVGVISVSRDITERKNIEEEERKRTDELERFTKLAVGRELRMIELKDRIRELEEKLKEKEILKGV